MSSDTKGPSLLERREIEAKIVGPLVRAFSVELGPERTLAILRQVITDLAHQNGAELAETLGAQTLEAFSQTLTMWQEGGALEIELIEQSADRLSFNVVRCRYAEMYRDLGLSDLGTTLSCQRDFALVEGFSPEIKLERTQTLMQGAPCCDFRFRRIEKIGSLEDRPEKQ